jgi:mRNA-degrading endonuclease toxin of MazEF toxin-antitoxin module
MVDYGMNVWTEINWIRPSIIFKNSNYKYWEDIFVIPMTSYKDEQEETKSKDEFDIEIESSEENWLSHKSLIKIRQLRCVSKKRFKLKKKTWNIIIRWELEKQYHDKIETSVKIIFWI